VHLAPKCRLEITRSKRHLERAVPSRNHEALQESRAKAGSWSRAKPNFSARPPRADRSPGATDATGARQHSWPPFQGQPSALQHPQAGVGTLPLLVHVLGKGLQRRLLPGAFPAHALRLPSLDPCVGVSEPAGQVRPNQGVQRQHLMVEPCSSPGSAPKTQRSTLTPPFPPARSCLQVLATGAEPERRWGQRGTGEDRVLPHSPAHRRTEPLASPCSAWAAGEPRRAHPRGFAKVSPGGGLRQGLRASTGCEPLENRGRKGKGRKKKKRKKKEKITQLAAQTLPGEEAAGWDKDTAHYATHAGAERRAERPARLPSAARWQGQRSGRQPWRTSRTPSFRLSPFVPRALGGGAGSGETQHHGDVGDAARTSSSSAVTVPRGFQGQPGSSLQQPALTSWLTPPGARDHLGTIPTWIVPCSEPGRHKPITCWGYQQSQSDREMVRTPQVRWFPQGTHQGLDETQIRRSPCPQDRARQHR